MSKKNKIISPNFSVKSQVSASEDFGVRMTKGGHFDLIALSAKAIALKNGNVLCFSGRLFFPSGLEI